ncbi:MAG: hypothetical protein ABI867_18875 [Kofleriaceae bacterium]
MEGYRQAIDRVVTPRVILAFGWTLFFIYSYPGYMSYDSVWQLEQARHIEPRNEWQPPLMAYVWGLIDKIIAGPFPMLVIQSGTFLFGGWALLRHAMSERAAAIVAVVVLLYPANIVVMAVIWKDCQMAGFLLAAIPALMSPKRGWRITGYVLIFLATGYRYNAAAATLPIVLGLFAWGKTLSRRRRYGISLGLWFGITVASLVANGLVTEKRMHPWQVAAAPLDIVGTMRFATKQDDATILREYPDVPWALKQDIWRRILYSYRSINSYLEVTTLEDAVIKPPTTEAERDGISAAWKKLVTEHPIAFARHRVGVFWQQIKVRTGGDYGFWVGFTNADWGEQILEHKAKHSSLQQWWIENLVRYDHWFGLRVYVYFILLFAFLPFAWRYRLGFVVIASGILHELGLFLIAPAIDYRYSHWMVVCSILGGILVFVKRRQQRVARQSPAG